MPRLPKSVDRFLTRQSTLSKIAENVSWLFVDKVFRMGVGVVITVWLARVLGPEQFGMLNFAIALASFFGVFASSGLQGIVVREIVQKSSSEEEALGSAIIIQALAGVVAYSFLMLLVIVLRPQDDLMRILVAITGSALLAKCCDVSAYWFEARVQSKYIVWVQDGVFALFSAVKVILIINEAPLIAFAWAYAGEALGTAAAMTWIFNKRGMSLKKLSPKLDRAKALLRDSWPLLLSGIAIIVYMKIDLIMLGELAGNEAVGVYSAAVRVSEMWYFAVGAILASVFPNLAALHSTYPARMRQRLVQAYTFMLWLSVTVAMVLSVFSGLIMNTLFGSEYTSSGPVLAIHAWAGVNVAVGTVWSKWILLENKNGIALQGHLLGAVINVALNIYLIPVYSAKGAAIATLASYWISALFVYSLHKPRETFGYLGKAATLRGVVWN